MLNYASLAWAPSLSNTHLNKLQTTQNKALRIITGCTQSTPISHLHAETLILSIQTHLDMRGMQFHAAATNNTDHPCHYMYNHTLTPRQNVQTPDRLLIHIHPHLFISTPGYYQHSSTHTHTYNPSSLRAIELAGNNSILGHPPPLISRTETQLSRSERVHLARLRCGHH